MTDDTKGSAYWDARFRDAGYAYGEEPNQFLAWAAPQIQPGRALSLCEGEGRNAVFLARLGFQVTAVDFSAVGLHKAKTLAAKHQVAIDCVLADLADLELPPDTWDLVVSVFAQPTSSIRQRLYAQLATTLTKGGAFVLESKSTDQTAVHDRYPNVQVLLREIAPLRAHFSDQGERYLAEGRYHLGLQNTSQILAFNL